MKKFINLFVFALMLPFVIEAKKPDNAKYLIGAVPQDDNGLVVFKQKIAIPNQSRDAIFNTLRAWVDGVAESSIHDLRTRLIDSKPIEGLLVYRIEEWMVFRKVFLNLDRTRFRYLLVVHCDDGMAEIAITQISYYYEEELDGTNGKTYAAEEWITDKYALNKKGTKLYPYSGKFRRKTIDRAEELFALARESFEVKQESVEQLKKTRIIE